MIKKFSAVIFLTCIAITPARSQFIDTTWKVDKFAGEAWFIAPNQIIGKTQYFYKGFAEGVFYECDYKGQSGTYTTYTNEDFFNNPEFSQYLPMREEITDNSSHIYAHRITCEGKGQSRNRRVLYPFVTNENREKAWYQFEGGVFSMSAEE